MKYAIVLPDGATDEPLPQLGGRTPLEAASTSTEIAVKALTWVFIGIKSDYRPFPSLVWNRNYHNRLLYGMDKTTILCAIIRGLREAARLD